MTTLSVPKKERAAKGDGLQAQFQSKIINPVSFTVFLILLIVSIITAALLDKQVPDAYIAAEVIGLNLIGLYVMFAFKIADQWEKAIVLRFAKFRGLKGPGSFWIVPVVDSVTSWIDHRVNVTPFNAERTLTKDTVPVDVDAVLFWVVWDAEKAALEVKDYQAAISWAAQTALRDIIGKMMLADILIGREAIDAELGKSLMNERRHGVSPCSQSRSGM